MPADPARLAAITARLAEWPEATLTPVVVRDELATDDSEAVRWPCLRHEEEAHVAFEFQRGEVTGQRETATPQGSVIEATVEVRQALAFCANCSPALGQAIAAAPTDIRWLLQQLAEARAEGARQERERVRGLEAAITEGEDRGMVEALMEAVRDEMESHYDPHEEREALLARLAAARGENATALAAAERAGAERALREAAAHPAPYRRDITPLNTWIAARLSALFPPPGAEVGRG